MDRPIHCRCRLLAPTWPDVIFPLLSWLNRCERSSTALVSKEGIPDGQWILLFDKNMLALLKVGWVHNQAVGHSEHITWSTYNKKSTLGAIILDSLRWTSRCTYAPCDEAACRPPCFSYALGSSYRGAGTRCPDEGTLDVLPGGRREYGCCWFGVLLPLERPKKPLILDRLCYVLTMSDS